MSGPRAESPKSNRGPAAGPENRRALLAAAREVYAEQGLGAPFSAVARRAGVGQGSLYRHFPDRVTLAAAVFEENVSELEHVARAEEATIDDLFDRVVEHAISTSAMIELTIANRQVPAMERLILRFRDIVGLLLARDQKSGRVGDHIDLDDVALAAAMLATEVARTDPPERAAAARRARALFWWGFAPR